MPTGSEVRVEGAPADVSRYINVPLGMQGTGESTSIAGAWVQMRQAGATARTLLVLAAAAQWHVAPAEITVVNGVVSHEARSATPLRRADRRCGPAARAADRRSEGFPRSSSSLAIPGCGARTRTPRPMARHCSHRT